MQDCPAPSGLFRLLGACNLGRRSCLACPRLACVGPLGHSGISGVGCPASSGMGVNLRGREGDASGIGGVALKLTRIPQGLAAPAPFSIPAKGPGLLAPHLQKRSPQGMSGDSRGREGDAGGILDLSRGWSEGRAIPPVKIANGIASRQGCQRCCRRTWLRSLPGSGL